MRLRIVWMVGLAACGSSAAGVVAGDGGGGQGGAAGADAALPDGTIAVDGAETDANGGRPEGACTGSGCAASDAGADATAADSTAPFVDAGCTDDGLAPGLGSPFPCGMETCFSRSQYCTWSVGGIRRGPQLATDDPKVGFFAVGQCEPLPCSCGAVPTCDCLKSSIMPLCFCIDEGGALGVQCDFL